MRLVVTAVGFAPATVSVSPDSHDLRITLDPAPFFDAVNVTSSRTDVPKLDPDGDDDGLHGIGSAWPPARSRSTTH